MSATHRLAKGRGIVPKVPFPETTLDEVAGCLRSKRKPKTIAQMNNAIAREVSRRRDRGRY